MAIRFDASTDAITTGSGLPGTSYTVTGWFFLSVNRGNWSKIWDLEAANGRWQYLGVNPDATNPRIIFALNGPGGTDVRGAVVGEWFFAAVVADGVKYTVHSAAPGGALDSFDWNNTPVAPTFLAVGGAGTFSDEWFNGRVAALKIWGAALTASQVEADRAQYQPARTTNLLHNHPFTEAELTDYAGGANHLTAGSTATAVEDGPPIPWSGARPRLILPTEAGGGVVVEQAVETNEAGSLTPPVQIPIDQAVERDTADGVIALQVVPVDSASETDVGNVAVPVVVFGLGDESNTASSITPVQLVAVEQAIEDSIGGFIVAQQRILTDQAANLESAQLVLPTILVPQVVESQIAFSVEPFQVVLLGQAVELSSASEINPPQVVVIDQAVEVDSSDVITSIVSVIAPLRTSSWASLISVLRETRNYQAAPLVACPNDGEPLLRSASGVLYCPFDGWRP